MTELWVDQGGGFEHVAEVKEIELPQEPSDGKFTVGIDWGHEDSSAVVINGLVANNGLTITPVGPIRRISKLYVCDAQIGDWPVTRTVRYFLPMDRRQARRVSRKTGYKFRVTRGEVMWRTK